MSTDQFNILQEIYDMYLQDRDEENEKLQTNLKRIDEINAYLNTVKMNSDIDYKIFSPRKEENFFQDRIESCEKEKLALEKENQFILLKINKLDEKNNQLKQFIKYFENSKIVPETENSQSKIYDVLDIQEKERQRIASELHDSSLQNLTHLVHMIELSSMYIDKDSNRAKLELENCIRFLKSIIGDVRDTIFNLRPMTFDDLGFKQCIDNLISNVSNEFRNFEIEYNVCELETYFYHDDSICQDENKRKDLFLVTIYRIIQEAIVNALKHSNGSKVILNVKVEDDKCFIEVRDDGKGFHFEHFSEKDDKHFGMSLIKERVESLNGSVLINTEPEMGTEIIIQVPLKNKEES